MTDAGFNSPTDDDLKVIARSRPELNRLRSKQRSGGNPPTIKGVKPGGKLCKICGEPIKLVSKEPNKLGYCIVCEKTLATGQTAVVSLIDGRHIFFASMLHDVEKEKDLFVAITGEMPKVWPEDFTIRGKALPTIPEKMDKLVQIYEGQNERN